MKRILNHALLSEGYLSSKQLWQDIAEKKTMSGEEIVFLYELWQEKLAQLQYEAWHSFADERLQKCLYFQTLTREFPRQFEKLAVARETALTNYGCGILYNVQRDSEIYVKHLLSLQKLWKQFPPRSEKAQELLDALNTFFKYLSRRML
jgi:hypothetical protein